MLFCLVAITGGAQNALADGGRDWFDPVVDFNSQIIEGIDKAIGSAGLAIIAYTLLVKLVTAPVNQVSMRTNVILQALQPQMQEIQRRYEAEEISEGTCANLLNKLYGEFSVLPLAGLLLPVLVQLPLLVALFRAVGRLAAQGGRFSEGFLWIPSLAGPVEVGRPSLDWLLKTQSAERFEPLIGWHDAQLYCVLPAVLVVLQLLTQQISPSPGNQGWVAYLFTGFVGIAALVSPQAVGIYWLVNTGCTAAQMTLVRGQVEEEFPKLARAASTIADGVRYTRKSEFREETEASKDVNRLAEELRPTAPRTNSRSARREKRRKRGRR